MQKIVFLFLTLFIFFRPVSVSAETINAGFISGIWYSKSSFFIDDKIRIYSAMRNNSGYDIIGTINFYDGQNVIGSSDFSVVDGQLIERWADWTVTPGTHNIYAKIVNPRKSEIGKEPVPITLAEDASAPDIKTATLDPAHLAPEILTSTTTASTSAQVAATTTPNPTAGADTASTTTTAQDDDKNILEKLVESVKKITDTIFNKSSPEQTGSTNEPTSGATSETSTGSNPSVTNGSSVSNDGSVSPDSSNNDTTTQTADGTKTSITAQFAQKLTATKNTLDQKLAEETNPQPVSLLSKPFTALQNKFTFLKIPHEYVPSSGRLYSWFLGALIFILHTWWLLIIIAALLVRWIWKIFRFFYFRNRE